MWTPHSALRRGLAALMAAASDAANTMTLGGPLSAPCLRNALDSDENAHDAVKLLWCARRVECALHCTLDLALSQSQPAGYVQTRALAVRIAGARISGQKLERDSLGHICA